MQTNRLSRETLLPMLADHILQHGLSGASLRPLAKAAWTSDRMLMYHFGNKESLVSDLLEYVAGRYSDALASGVGPTRAANRRECVMRILHQTRQPEMRPFMALWWEIVAGSARGMPGYERAADHIMTKMLAWMETQMPADDPDPAGGARFLLTVIEGALMLNAVGHVQTAQDGLMAHDLYNKTATNLAGNLSAS